MATIFMLTKEPVRVTATGGQDLRLAQEVGDFHELDVSYRLLEGSGTVSLKLETGMQTDSTDGWVDLGSAFTGTAAPYATKQTITNPLRFVRWNLTNLGGGAGVTFLIQIIGRTL